MVRFCSLFSGSSGNCYFFGSEKTKVLVDAGLSGKAIRTALQGIDEKAEDIQGILLTHEHIDHVKGAGVLSRALDIPIYATEGTWQGSLPLIGRIEPKNVVCIEAGGPFNVGDLYIEPYGIPHDALDPVGFCLTANQKKVVVATDIGKMTKSLLKQFENSDLLFLESNHDKEMLKVGRYPQSVKRRILGDKGHLCNEIAAKTACYMAKTGVTRIVLGHLSENNNFKELAYATTVMEMKKEGMIPGKDVTLDIVDRHTAGKLYIL